MIKKTIFYVVLYSTLINSMQESFEYKAPPKYLFINVITLICPDEQKQENHVREKIMAQESIGTKLRLLTYSLNKNLKTDTKKDLFDFLENIELPTYLNYTHTTDLYIDDQRKAPPIFCAYCLKTDEDAQKIYDHAKEHLKKQDGSSKTSPTKETSWFSLSSWTPDFTPEKQMLLSQGLDVMFNNNQRNTVLELCSDMLQILQRVKEESLTIVLTANMSHSCCYELLKLNNLHDFFIDIHASDKAGYLTSQKEFYETFIKEKKIKPEECLVIDEHAENLLGAQSLGMPVLHKYKNETFHDQLKMIVAAKKTSDTK